MRNLKRMTATESFEQLPDTQKRCQVHNIVECQTKKFLERVKNSCGCTPWALMTNNTEKACGPEKEGCVAEQPLRDQSCLVPCAGLYADITEESFFQQLRQKERRVENVEDNQENLRFLTEEYTNYKQNYVRQLWFDPKEQNLSMCFISFTMLAHINIPRECLYSWFNGSVFTT